MATSLSVAEVRAQIPGSDRDQLPGSDREQAIWRALPDGWLSEREMRDGVKRIAGLPEWNDAAAAGLVKLMEVAGLLRSRVSDVPNVGEEFCRNPEPPEPRSFQEQESARIAAQASWEDAEKERFVAERNEPARKQRAAELAEERQHIHALVDERLKELGIHPEHSEPALAGS